MAAANEIWTSRVLYKRPREQVEFDCDDDLRKLAERSQDCKKLNCADATRITDAGLAHLETLPLYQLVLSGCKKITDVGLSHLSRSDQRRGQLPGTFPLLYLDLNCCDKITDAGLAHLTVLPLVDLDLGYCSGLIPLVIQKLVLPTPYPEERPVLWGKASAEPIFESRAVYTFATCQFLSDLLKIWTC